MRSYLLSILLLSSVFSFHSFRSDAAAEDSMLLLGTDAGIFDGIAVSGGDKDYLVTSQQNLIGSGRRLDVRDSSGKKVEVDPDGLELSDKRDIARIPLKNPFPGALKPGKMPGHGSELRALSMTNADREKCSLKTAELKARAFGVRSVELKGELDPGFSGAILADADSSFLGLVSETPYTIKTGTDYIDYTGKIVPSEKFIGFIYDEKIEWRNIRLRELSGVTAALHNVRDTTVLGRYIAVANAWCINPYTKLDFKENEVPDSMSSFLEAQNRYVDRYPKYLAQIEEDYKHYQSIAKSLRDKKQAESVRLASFFKTYSLSLETSYPSTYMEKLAGLYRREIDKYENTVTARGIFIGASWPTVIDSDSKNLVEQIEEDIIKEEERRKKMEEARKKKEREKRKREKEEAKKGADKKDKGDN